LDDNLSRKICRSSLVVSSHLTTKKGRSASQKYAWTSTNIWHMLCWQQPNHVWLYRFIKKTLMEKIWLMLYTNDITSHNISIIYIKLGISMISPMLDHWIPIFRWIRSPWVCHPACEEDANLHLVASEKTVVEWTAGGQNMRIMSIYLSICLPICLSIYPSIHPIDPIDPIESIESI
jgi:hypothetical protein